MRRTMDSAVARTSAVAGHHILPDSFVALVEEHHLSVAVLLELLEEVEAADASCWQL